VVLKNQNQIAYNGAGDKSEFGGENMTAHMRLR
jgi:hypothetical protein